jgi:hypothetical protein
MQDPSCRWGKVDALFAATREPAEEWAGGSKTSGRLACYGIDGWLSVAVSRGEHPQGLLRRWQSVTAGSTRGEARALPRPHPAGGGGSSSWFQPDGAAQPLRPQTNASAKHKNALEQ